MPTLTIPNSFSAATTAQSAQVNANFNAVATLLNSTLLANDNIQTGGIATANLAANAVTGAKLNSNVVDDSSLQYSSSQLSIKALGVGTSHLAANAVTTAKITDANVTTAKLADGAVTPAKRAALGQQVSSGSSTFSTTNASYTDVTNLSVSITTTGRPVFIGTTSDPAIDDGAGGYYRGNLTVAGSVSTGIKVLRDSTQVLTTNAGHSSATNLYTPASSVWTIDTPSAGTYTYKVQIKCVNANNVYAINMVLIAYEL